MAIQFPPVNPGDPSPTDGDTFTYAPTQTEYIYDQTENSWSVVIENATSSPVNRIIAGSSLITLNPADGDLNKSAVTIDVVDQLASLGSIKAGSNVTLFPTNGDLKNGDVTITAADNGSGEPPELVIGDIIGGNNITIGGTGNADLLEGNVTIDGPDIPEVPEPLWKKTNNILSPKTDSDDVQVLDSAGGAFLINELANIDSI